MARRKIELFIEVNTEKEFENALNHHRDKLICAETYSSHFGSCMALDRLLWLFKMDWSNEEVILLKVLVDNIAALARLRGQSEPFYMFIVNHRVTKVFRGVDCMRFADVAKMELQYYREGAVAHRRTFALDEATPDELERINKRAEEKEKQRSSWASRRAARQAARKRHRAERMAPYLTDLNFVLFWPHARHAHPELYERWDMNNIIMVGREEVELTPDQAHDVLYAGDAPLNEASIHALTTAPALAICFRILDTDKHFVSLVRKILYEEIVPPTENARNSQEVRNVCAYDFYKSYSPTREQIRQKRHEDRIKRKHEEKERKERHLAEKKRLAQQAKEEEKEAKRAAKEQLKLDLLKSGNVSELNKLKAEPDDDEIEDQEEPELEIEEAEEEACEEEEDENEYFPPAGLEVPGLYSPPNDIAKANGLALLFHKLVLEKVTPLPEFLPPHVLVMLHIQKRQKALQIIAVRQKFLIHMGIFKASTPYKAVHVAYSVKQFEAMDLTIDVTEDLKLCLMVSIKVDTLLLELMDLSPLHVSKDSKVGEEECAAMFRVDYGDNYSEFEDFDTESNDCDQ